jgi:protein ImuA
MPAAVLNRSFPRAALELPEVWCADQLAQAPARAVPTGHAPLDAQLPGGGWPLGGMIEVLQAFAALHVWQLVLPGLVQTVREQPGPVVLVDAPCQPFGPSLEGQGLPGERLLCVRAAQAAAGGGAAALWAAEQALRCAEVAAVMAWLPQARSTDLRRLHMAAQQHGRLLFVFRGLRAQREASPAMLRLRVEGVDALHVQILKRRGPPLETPIDLPAHPARLAALLAARHKEKDAALPASGAVMPVLRIVSPNEKNHALDRPVAA